ncbi:pleckstrin homology-like domain family B member 3 isoform X2 [Heterodontus francisci]|uniref:pleckstrin homology-like domain family B member 3 isoform X2 n=1 Tax=Heterodontus francisci TaxID=7792 RepID=UPI00355C77BA
MIDLAVALAADSDPEEEGLSGGTGPRRPPSSDRRSVARVSGRRADNEIWEAVQGVSDSTQNGGGVCHPDGIQDPVHQDPPVSGPVASRTAGERFQTATRITAVSQRLTDLEQQKEELEQEMEMELALVQGELNVERQEQKEQLHITEELCSRITTLGQTHQAKKDKEKTKVEKERRKLEEARERLAASRRWFEAQPESAKQLLRERLQEEAEAVDIAQKTFEDLEFQSLERQSSLDEERETQTTLLKQEVSVSRQREADRKDDAMVLNLDKLNLRKCGSGTFYDRADRMKQPLLFVKMPRPVIVGEGNRQLTGSTPCVLSASRISASNTFLKEHPLCWNGSGSLPRKQREGHRTKELERPVSLHEKGLALAPMRLLSLVSLHRSNSFGMPRPSVSCPPLGVRLPSPPGPTDQPRLQSTQTSSCIALSPTSSLHSDGGSLQTLADMEKKLRDAVKERERLLRAREAQRRVQEEAQRGEKVLNGESVMSTEQAKPPAIPVQSEALRIHRVPVVQPTFDLRSHIEASGHGVEACQHLTLTGRTCRGFLTKMGGRIKTWKKRWFVFDGSKRRLAYFADKEESKLKGVIYFQAIEEVYFDHLRSAPKSPSPPLTFCLKTYDRLFYMVAPTDVALRIWMEVILTAVEGNVQF